MKRTREDHFTTGLLAGVILGLLLGYVWKVVEIRNTQGAVNEAAGTQQLVDRF